METMSLCSKTIDHANIVYKIDQRKDRPCLCSQDVQRQERCIRNNEDLSLSITLFSSGWYVLFRVSYHSPLYCFVSVHKAVSWSACSNRLGCCRSETHVPHSLRVERRPFLVLVYQFRIARWLKFSTVLLKSDLRLLCEKSVETETERGLISSTPPGWPWDLWGWRGGDGNAYITKEQSRSCVFNSVAKMGICCLECL